MQALTGGHDGSCGATLIQLPEAGRTAPVVSEPRIVRKAVARDDVLKFAHPVPQSELPNRWGVGKPTVSEWLSEWEAEGIVRRVRSGRTCTVQFAGAGKLRIVR